MSESKFEEFPYGELGIIVVKNIENLAKEVDELLVKKSGATQSYLLKIIESRFSSDEGKVTIDESVRGRDILIISDVGNYGLKYNMFGEQTIVGPGEHFQDIKRVISATNGKASRINVMMPLLYSSRRYRRKSGESLDYTMAFQRLESMGADRIYTFDVHDSNVQNAIPLMASENICPTAEIVNYFLEKREVTTDELDKKDIIIISPGTSAIDRAIYYSGILKQDIGLFYEGHDYTKVVDGKNPIIRHKYIGRKVDGKDILIVDDMIASGGSVVDIAKQLKRQNAKRMFYTVSFALFTEGPGRLDQIYSEGFTSGIYSTNLTCVPESTKDKEWFHAVDIGELMSEFIHHIDREESISILLDKTRGVNIL